MQTDEWQQNNGETIPVNYSWRNSTLVIRESVTGKHIEDRRMARPERFELPTYSSGGCRSIQLSYGRA